MRRNRRLHRCAMAAALLPAAFVATAMSITAAAHEPAARVKLSASEKTVNVGDRFALGGAVPGSHGATLRIQFRAGGAHDWRLVKKVHTDTKGRYGLHTHALKSGAYRAVPKRASGASAPELVNVRSSASLHLGSHNVVLGHSIAVRGLVKPGGERKVKVVVKGAGHGVVADRTSAKGAFGTKFTPTRSGVYSLRAVPGANEQGAGGTGVKRQVTVFRYAGASWYGPGLYGNALACGGTLQYGMIGVANKTLPCGTKVRLRYNGRTITAPVIDRGPYAAGRDYDLTEATKNALGFPDVGTILASR